MSKLRRKLKESGVEYRVVKNNLAAIAAKNVGKEHLKDLLVGPSAVAFGHDDEVAAARVLTEYIRVNKAGPLHQGWIPAGPDAHRR